ncbi:MAG: hypothetical protein RL136_1785 [Planctomycetota bacterium]|jgi:hypothetical protein
MSYEERRALLDDPDPPAARRSTPVVAIAFALAAALGVAASAWLWTRLEDERSARADAEVRFLAEKTAREAAAAESASRIGSMEATIAAKEESIRRVEEARDRSERAADALIGSFLRSSESELGGSTTALARETLRGGALEELSRSLPEEKYLAVALAVVEALAREPSAANAGELYRDLTFATDFLGRAKAVLEPESSTMGDALHAVAELMWSSRRLAFVDAKVDAALKSDAARFAADARAARKAKGGRRLALTLVLLAEIEREEKRLTEAALLLSDADLEILKDGSPLEAAAVELELAEVQFELGRREQAVDLLDARAKSLSALEVRELPQGPAAALRLRETRMRMLDAMGVARSDPARWTTEQVVLARAQLAAGRHADAYAVLPAVIREYERDQSRFRERLECTLMLARAMAALGSPVQAYELLDRKALVDDARVLGAEHPLAREFELLRAELQSRR